MALTVCCPYCASIMSDDLEVFDANVPYEVRCDGCSKVYTFQFIECERCGHETTFGWPHAPSQEAVMLLECAACGARLKDEAKHEGEAVEDEWF